MDFTSDVTAIPAGGFGVPRLFSQEMIDDTKALYESPAFIRGLFATTSLVDTFWLRLAFGNTYEPGLTMADEVALLELGPLDTSDQPERVVHYDCWTCDCYGWGW